MLSGTIGLAPKFFCTIGDAISLITIVFGNAVDFYVRIIVFVPSCRDSVG